MSVRSVIAGVFHGIVLTLIVALSLMAAHEDLIFDQIVSQASSEDMGQQERAIALVETAHSIMDVNFKVLGSTRSISAIERYIGSSDVHLLSPKGHCGSYAHVLARLLQRAEFDVRIAQMECSNKEVGCHIVVEAKIGGRYVPLDSMYNVYFFKKDETLATYEEVGTDWAYYSQQLPEAYPGYFDYHNVNYTNWNKIPLLMPFIKQVLELFIGEKVHEISIRPYVLNVYKTYMIAVIAAYVLGILFFLLLANRRRVRV